MLHECTKLFWELYSGRATLPATNEEHSGYATSQGYQCHFNSAWWLSSDFGSRIENQVKG